MTAKSNLLVKGQSADGPWAAVFGRTVDPRETWVRCTPPPAPHNLLSQLETFRVYGELKNTKTIVKNTLPTKQVIADEKLAIEYDVTRRTQPHCINYNVYRREMREAGEKVKFASISN